MAGITIQPVSPVVMIATMTTDQAASPITLSFASLVDMPHGPKLKKCGREGKRLLTLVPGVVVGSCVGYLDAVEIPVEAEHR